MTSLLILIFIGALIFGCNSIGLLVLFLGLLGLAWLLHPGRIELFTGGDDEDE